MRALFTTQPGFGHLNPTLPYAVALRDAGHEVRFATAPAFAEAVEAHDFPCWGIGEDFTWERAHEYFPESIEAAKRGRGIEYAVFEIGWERWMPKAARDLIPLVEEWAPDVIVREFAENAATIVGVLLKVPVVCAAWTAPPADGSTWGRVWDWERWVDCCAEKAGDLGVPDLDPMEVWARQLVLSGLPPSWFRLTGCAATIRHFRLSMANDSDGPPPGCLAQLGVDRPVIYATLGTVFNRMRRVRSAMLEALAGVDADIVMTIGRDVETEEVGVVPDNVRVEQFIPQHHVFARASLLVSHAGLGTMLGAIYAGVPMVLIAVGGDQPANARLAGELGLARAFELDSLNVGQLQAAITAALEDPAMRQTAANVRDECRTMMPVSAAVAVLEDLANARTARADERR